MNDNEQGIPKEKHAGGRPTKKTPETIDKLLSLIEAGLSNISACEAAGVSPRSFYEWLDSDEEFMHKYARANNIYADVKGDAIVRLAHHISQTPDFPADKGRLLIDTEKWHLGKTAPKKYGEHQRIELDGKLDVAVDASDVILKDFLSGIEKKGGAQGG